MSTDGPCPQAVHTSLRARGCGHEDALGDALDGVTVDEARRVYPPATEATMLPSAEQNRKELREVCAADGDWGGTQWGAVILDLLDRLESAEAEARWFRAQADHHIGRANRAEQARCAPATPCCHGPVHSTPCPSIPAATGGAIADSAENGATWAERVNRGSLEQVTRLQREAAASFAEGDVRCHCGEQTAAATDPGEWADLGPAPRHLCVDCALARCDAYPAHCPSPTRVVPPGEGQS